MAPCGWRGNLLPAGALKDFSGDETLPLPIEHGQSRGTPAVFRNVGDAGHFLVRFLAGMAISQVGTRTAEILPVAGSGGRTWDVSQCREKVPGKAP
jgi:hypothetical protein